MIGHYLLTLNEKQEDRVLTRKMRARGSSLQSIACLVITAQFRTDELAGCEARGKGLLSRWPPQGGAVFPPVARHYDVACDRFGTERVNSAIRNRILSNRARRVLSVPEQSAVA
jgi:hypothetical protein